MIVKTIASLIILLCLSLCCSLKADAAENRIALPVLNGQSAMNVWYHIPSMSTSSTPIVFVMHGVLRNADEYRDNWISLAEQYNFVVIVPEFDKDTFPGSRSYNLGNLLNEDGQPVPEKDWSFSLIGPVFEQFKTKMGFNSEKFYIFGHSAGSQFVHRLLMFKPELPVEMAFAANAGWYTLPINNQQFPYGLKGSGTDKVNLKQFFALPMVILLGDKDNDPKDEYLRTTAEANLQGPHRFARGNYYYQLANNKAIELGVDLNWQLVVAPDIGHQNAKMAPFAAELISKHIRNNEY